MQSFPEAFRVGMAARATSSSIAATTTRRLGPAVRERRIHIAVSVFSDSEQTWRRTMDIARQHYKGRPGVTVVASQDFGAQPGDLNPLGYKDGIGQPAIEGSGVDPLPGQGRPSKPGIYPRLSRGGRRAACDAAAGCARAQRYLHWGTQVPIAGRSVQPIPPRQWSNDEERELLAAKLVGRWRSGAPLTLAPVRDDPALGQDPQRNNDFNYANDPHGKQVPLGCHMRRMNPRDTKMPVLTDVNIHRIIRRSTTYGAPYDPNALSEQRR